MNPGEKAYLDELQQEIDKITGGGRNAEPNRALVKLYDLVRYHLQEHGTAHYHVPRKSTETCPNCGRNRSPSQIPGACKCSALLAWADDGRVCIDGVQLSLPFLGKNATAQIRFDSNR